MHEVIARYSITLHDEDVTYFLHAIVSPNLSRK